MVEYAINEDLKTAELVWSYTKEGNYTRSGGSAWRLENGNTLIGWARGPEDLLTEVNAEGEIVLEMRATLEGHPLGTYRAFRFDE